MRLHGVISTDVGYAGGSSRQPSFHDISDHVEAVRIHYDRRAISYEELLEAFWKVHDPTADMEDRYASRIFYISDEQRRLAKAFLASKASMSDETIETRLEPLGRFWEAESYHQHYLAKLRGER